MSLEAPFRASAVDSPEMLTGPSLAESMPFPIMTGQLCRNITPLTQHEGSRILIAVVARVAVADRDLAPLAVALPFYPGLYLMTTVMITFMAMTMVSVASVNCPAPNLDPFCLPLMFV